ETRSVGNIAAATQQVNQQAADSTALSISARWDGDKVRGLRMVLRNGTVISAGGVDDTDYPLTSYTFGDDETLRTLSMSSSGYGYGSLRRLEFTTSTGGKFQAGPAGIDDLVSPPVNGARLVGFHAWVNQDNFINALAFDATNEAPMQVNVQNLSSWTCSYAGGVLMVNNVAAIQVADAGMDKHGLASKHNRAVQVSSGGVNGYCAYDGNATLNIAVFADATFEAKFGVDEGDGSVYGAIAGVSASPSKPALVDALVKKYAPIFMLNADEVYWPANVDTFLPHMIMQTVLPNGVPVDYYKGPLTRNALAVQATALGANNTGTTACLRTSADLNSPSDTQDWFYGTLPTSSQVTTYAVVVEGQNGKLDIVYWWFFNYNQGKTVAGTSWGNHVSDWEHIKVQLGGVDFASPQGPLGCRENPDDRTTARSSGRPGGPGASNADGGLPGLGSQPLHP
ncbi:MAG: hypothetical protein ACXW1Y_11585, partial [Acidimicrobiia bacterium]